MESGARAGSGDKAIRNQKLMRYTARFRVRTIKEQVEARIRHRELDKKKVLKGVTRGSPVHTIYKDEVPFEADET